MEKVKPKEVLLNLPHVMMFDEEEQIPEFATNVNAILHGKQRFKYESLGRLAGKYVGIFYLHRNDEYQELRDEFMMMIDFEEINNSPHTVVKNYEPCTCAHTHGVPCTGDCSMCWRTCGQ